MRPDSPWPRRLLIAAGLLAALLLLVLPLSLIFTRVIVGGWTALVQNLGSSDMRAAIGLTLLAAVISVPVNLVFGVLLAWCVTRYDFRGRRVLIALVDIPYATSPVVAGLCYLVVYGLEGAFGRWLNGHGVQLLSLIHI